MVVYEHSLINQKVIYLQHVKIFFGIWSVFFYLDTYQKECGLQIDLQAYSILVSRRNLPFFSTCSQIVTIFLWCWACSKHHADRPEMLSWVSFSPRSFFSNKSSFRVDILSKLIWKEIWDLYSRRVTQSTSKNPKINKLLDSILIV